MTLEPDPTAVRVALWRALHLEVDAPPYVLQDPLGARLAGPPEGWRQRPDMDPVATRGFRAAVVARSRYVEDLTLQAAATGVRQAVLLGAGLDTFALRRPPRGVTVFEVDRPGASAWKRGRLEALAGGVPGPLRLVPVDFETGASWRDALAAAGFDPAAPAVVSSLGVSLYLTREAIQATLAEGARLAAGSTFAMTFLLPPAAVASEDRGPYEQVLARADAAGTPFLSLFEPEEALALARSAGFRSVRHVPGAELGRLFFRGRKDGLAPSSGEDFLIAQT